MMNVKCMDFTYSVMYFLTSMKIIKPTLTEFVHFFNNLFPHTIHQEVNMAALSLGQVWRCS